MWECTWYVLLSPEGAYHAVPMPHPTTGMLEPEERETCSILLTMNRLDSRRSRRKLSPNPDREKGFSESVQDVGVVFYSITCILNTSCWDQFTDWWLLSWEKFKLPPEKITPDLKMMGKYCCDDQREGSARCICPISGRSHSLKAGKKNSPFCVQHALFWTIGSIA